MVLELENRLSFPGFNSIRVFPLYRKYDWRADTFFEEANRILKQWSQDNKILFPSIVQVTTLKSYFIGQTYSLEKMDKIAKNLLVDPVIEGYMLNGFTFKQPKDHKKTIPFSLTEFDYMAEISYLPGVVDNEGRTFYSAIKDYLKEDFFFKTHTASGIIYLLKFASTVDSEVVKKLFTSLLVNPLIDRLEVKKISDGENWEKCYSLFTEFFKEFSLQIGNKNKNNTYETIPITKLSGNPEALKKLSQERLLYLSEEEMEAVIKYYSNLQNQKKRQGLGLPSDPTDVELEVIAQTWSEHCKHKIFAARIDYYEDGVFKESIDSLYSTYIKKVTAEIRKSNPNLLSVFSDNSGIFRFTDEMAICMKVETHNSPSSLDPFGGAITGIVGVNRDIIGTGIGAKPLFNTDVFCFGFPDYSGPLPPKLFHPQRVMKGVHKGVERGGNESGIPTINGAMVFDNRFIGKPLVFCGTGGVLPTVIKHGDKVVDCVSKKIYPGDLIAMVGGRIGKDGIHGATFSSVILDETLPSSVVQIGDPIVQKKMLDFLIVARDSLLYRTITDNGAGGLSSSVGEMALLSHGCQVELGKALLKYPDLKPWEIMVSESQERMTLAVPIENREKLEVLAQEYDVEICFIGQFTDDGFFSVYYNECLVACLGLDFLHKGVPQLSLKANWTNPVNEEVEVDDSKEKNFYENALKGLLSRPNVASKEKWVRRYDHEVKALTILKPYDGIERDAPMDAAVIKPLRNSDKGLVISNGLFPRYSDIDSYAMAAMGVDEAVRNAVASGGNPEEMYALDNFCWPDPIASPHNLDGEYKLAQLVRANKAIYDVCSAYRLPLISGKDSMKNDYGKGIDKISVPPTLLVTVLSVISDYRKICSTAFKQKNSLIYWIGKFDGRMGGSEFYGYLNKVGKETPQINTKENFQVYRTIHQVVKKDLILSAHDISDGGLAVALVESCFGSWSGVEVDLRKLSGNYRSWQKLFSEPAGCFVVEVEKRKKKKFVSFVKKYTPYCYEIGVTLPDYDFLVKDSSRKNNKVLIKKNIKFLKEIWKTSLDFN